jgi:hypothetical protein
MNWNMIGALGELIGALAVVLTLFYLAQQLKASALESKRTRWREVNLEVSQAADNWASDDTLADIMFRGFGNPGSLSPVEVFRFNATFYRFFRAWEGAFQASREGGISDWGVEGLNTAMSTMLGTPGAQFYWEQRRLWFSPSFRAEVDQMLTTTDSTMIEDWHRNE